MCGYVFQSFSGDSKLESNNLLTKFGQNLHLLAKDMKFTIIYLLGCQEHVEVLARYSSGADNYKKTQLMYAKQIKKVEKR